MAPPPWCWAVEAPCVAVTWGTNWELGSVWGSTSCDPMLSLECEKGKQREG